VTATRTGDSRVNPKSSVLRPRSRVAIYKPPERSAPSSISWSCWRRCCGSAFENRAQRQGQSRRAEKITSGFGFPRQHGGLRHQPVAHCVQRSGHLRPACSSSAFSTRCWSPRSASCSRPSSASSSGLARLSSNWLVARLAGGYVELIRNLPLLFPAPVLVSRRAGHAAGTAPKHLAVRRDLPQQPRHHRARAGGGRGDRRGHRRVSP